MMQLNEIVLFLVGIINYFLALVVYLRNKKSTLHKMFCLSVFALGSWNISVILLILYPGTFTGNLTALLGFLMGVGLMSLVYEFPHPQVRQHRLYYALTGASGLLVLLGAGAGLVVRNVEAITKPTFGPGYFIMMLNALAISAYVLQSTIKKYRQSKGHARMQMKYLFSGFFSFLGLVLLTNVILPNFGMADLAAIGPLFSLIFVVFAGYAIVKHRLMDVRFLVLRTAAYSIVVVAFAVGYIGASYLFLQRYPGIVNRNVLVLVFMSLAVVGTFPLKRLLERATEKLFAKSRYDAGKLLKQLGEIVSTKVFLQDIQELVLKTLMNEMKVQRALFVVFPTARTVAVCQFGFDQLSKQLLKSAKNLLTGNSALLTDELREASREKNLARKLKIELFLPLFVGKELIGVLALGEKRSGDMFTAEDLKVLEIAAPQLATGVKKALILKEWDEVKEQRIQELNSLNGIVLSLGSTLDLDNVLLKVVEEAIAVTGAESGSIMLLDEETKTLSVAASKWIHPEVVEEARTRLGEGVSGWVAKHGEALLLVAGKHENEQLENLLKRQEITSSLAVPLMAKGVVRGVLNVNRKKKKEVFTRQDLNLISLFAHHAAEHIENARLHKQSESQFMETINSLSKAVDAKDNYTHGHSEAVTKHAVDIATELGLPPDEVRNIEIAGRLHDIGKIGIPGEILNKTGELTAEEREIIKEHPKIAVTILQDAPSVNSIKPLIRFHHERFDGGGYPAGLSGNEIPLGARILAVADSFDAMRTTRPYRAAFSLDKALAELNDKSGSQFDPEVVKVFLRIAGKKSTADTPSKVGA